MTDQEASDCALRFLAQQGVPRAAIIRTDRVLDLGFLVFYDDERAVAGDARFKLFGNVPVVVSTTGAATFSGDVVNFVSFAQRWLLSLPKAPNAT